MENERLILAVGRIENALTKIETQWSTQQTSETSEQQDSYVKELENRHNELKKELTLAIETIDELIAVRENGHG